MKDSSVNSPKSVGKSNLLLIIASLCALVATFLVSNAAFKFETKLLVFGLVVFLYLLFCLTIYIWQKRKFQSYRAKVSDKSFDNDEIEGKLLALEEVNQFFGASLKSKDMFRLVASRVNEMIPFTVCTLYMADTEKSKLKVVHAVGENAERFVGIEIKSVEGLAGNAFQSLKAEFDDKLRLDNAVIAADILENLSSGIAAPLLQNAEAYGVLVLYARKEDAINQDSLQLLEAVGARVAPLFLSSRAFEENLANALTDSLTNLPNDRAFYMVLENQIAESQRFREERPLTVLTIDVVNFEELNQKYGHATGDRMLRYAAEIIKNQLRQMDFLARASGDEFLAVLPTASNEITLEIVERIKKIFVSKPFELSRQEKINLQLSFGAASFGKDGETAAQLLKHAHFRKQQSKKTESNILWFPKEYVN